MNKIVRYTDSQPSSYLKTGTSYVIDREDDKLYYIKLENGESRGFFKWGFEVVSEPPKKRVKYTDLIGTSWLERDTIYEVEKEDKLYYWIETKSYSLQPFIKSRFEVVDDPSKEVQYYEVIKKPPLTIHEKGGRIASTYLFEECSKYPEFFKPVYKPQFKAGDKVTDDDGKNVYTYKEFRDSRHLIEGHTGALGINARLATPEEIERVTDITIAGYKMELREDNRAVKFGGHTISRDNVMLVRYLMGTCIGAEITVHGEKLTIEKVDKILSKLK